MTRIIGPPKSRRRHWTFMWCLVVAIGVGIFYIPGALAVHETGAFELDGNAVSANAACSSHGPRSVAGMRMPSCRGCRYQPNLYASRPGRRPGIPGRSYCL